MLKSLIESLLLNEPDGLLLREILVEREVPAKSVLLHAGQVSSHIYFVKKGCLRQWFNKDGRDITLQFFFEDQAVASIDSFMGQQPSLFTIESIEPSTIIAISKEAFDKLLKTRPEIRDGFLGLMFQRFRNYALLFLSRIKDSPRERYDDLLKNHPEILKRVPQHYIASFLGITPISLSRIRNRR